MKLRLFLFISLSIAALIPVIMYGVWPHSRAYEKELSDVSERHLLLAQNIGAALERYSRDLKATFMVLTDNMVNGTRLVATDEVLSNLHFRHICVAQIDDGLVVDELSDEKTRCPKYVPEERFDILKNIAPSSGVVFTEVMPGPKGVPIIYIVQRIDDKLAIGAITTNYFVELGKAISFGKRGHAAIVDHTGKVLAHPLENWWREMKDISKVSSVKRMLNKETGVSTFYSPALKGDMIAGFSWVTGANWGVMIPQPLSELQERADVVQQHAMGVIILGVLLTAIASWILSGYLTKPVLAVVKAAHSLEEGKHDITVEPSTKVMPKELRILTDSFNSMAKALGGFSRSQAKAVAEAESANKAKTDFLGNMSHELRTPLNAIIGFSQIIEEEVLGPVGHAKYVEYATDIGYSGRHLLAIVNDLLDLTTIDVGQIVLKEKEIDMVSTIRLCAHMITGRKDRSANRISFEAPTEFPFFLGDERLITQILLNILSNSNKFTPLDGHITVHLGLLDSGGMNIKISDTGCGIESEDILTVLEPFGQARSNTHHSHEGTGLGLSISKSLTEIHDGIFTLESTPDIGTIVNISFSPQRTVNK